MDVLEKINKENYNKWKNDKGLVDELKNWLTCNTNIDVFGLSKQEMVYLIRNGYTENPKCYCGEPIKYAHGKYRKYCSSKCSANSQITNEKRLKTVKMRYGCENVFQNNDIKAKIYTSNEKKYGHKNPHRIGSDNFKNSMLNKYGVYNASELDFVNDKRRNNLYDSTYDNLSRFKDSVIPLFSREEYKGCGYDKIYKWHCVKCDNDFMAWYHNGWIPRCSNCIRSSSFQDEVEEYLMSIGADYSVNNRTILNGLEIDIYIPEYNIGIECNGNFWHSELNGKNKSYHINKTKKCVDAGIQLIHIFEDEWFNMNEIVKRRLRHKFKNTKYKLYARKCEIRDISTDIKDKFLNKYHIQGKDRSSIRLGAFYKDRLVAVMTFGKRRFDNKSGYELIRYVTVGSFNCIGVASKLLKHFERNYSPSSLISYADLRWSNGNVYEKLGFVHTKNSPVGYFYLKGDYLKRINRIQFQKHKLSKMLDIFDANKSEWENMKANGYNRIWDCGNMVFEKYY